MADPQITPVDQPTTRLVPRDAIDQLIRENVHPRGLAAAPNAIAMGLGLEELPADLDAIARNIAAGEPIVITVSCGDAALRIEVR